MSATPRERFSLFLRLFGFLDEILGTALGFHVGLGEIAAEDSDAEQLNAAKEQHQADRRGEARDRITEDQRLDREE